MRWARGLRAASVAVAALLAAGCANLPFLADPPASIAPGAPDSTAPADRAEYRLEVQAPAPLRELLTNYLDLARFQNAPVLDAINAAELERLVRATPAQARALLETEGYFNAEVTVQRATGAAPGAGGDAAGPPAPPLLRVIVDPGPRATVAEFELDAVGALPSGAAAGDANAQRELAALREAWPLPPGSVFRQADWLEAKNRTLARLRAGGYAAASWQSTNARVDAPSNRVDIAVVADSGPLFRLGPLQIEGLSRYDESTVRNLADFSAGRPYSEKLLLDYQERLQRVGLFEGASVELDAEVATAGAAPVRVRVKELPLQQATVGIGYSGNTGARLSFEHTHRRVLGTRWVAKNSFELGAEQQKWEGDLTSHPLPGLYRNLVSGSATRLRTDDQLLLGWNARAGRKQETPRIDRLYFAELTHARVDSDVLTSQAEALSANTHWVFRDLDSVLLPTRGVSANAQLGLGHARGSRSLRGAPAVEASDPFARVYARLTAYRPFGDAWFGTARIEAGQVFTRNVIGIPDTLLFRAGGDDSVRGYEYRTLAPSVAGETVGGRTLLAGSLEIARPISARLPAIWWAGFIDAGNAADRLGDLKPAVGYGVGLRWRSPVGPLRVDLAYGQKVRRLRLHVSVGITF